jgi:ribosomal protein S18 acetylase RimI-like enzyme
VSNTAIIYPSLTLPLDTVTLRALRAEDLRALEWQGGQNLRGFYEDLWRAHHDEEIHVVVADFNHFPIGLAVIHWPGKPTQPGVPDIQSLRVHPIFRGLKIGSHLMSTCEEIIAARGFEKVGLSVGLENVQAKKLYERHGYCVEGAPYCDVWYYTDAQGIGVRVEENVLDMVKNL